jgi:hypothetical protein
MKKKLESLCPSDATPCSASFVRMFKPQFAGLVERGEKLQTVRPTPKRMPKPGDKISLRCWTDKPYRSKQRVLRDAIITRVAPIEIGRDRMVLDGGRLPPWKHDAFARADGFSDREEMEDWFRATHGLPFVGILISWQSV